jgi:hypothetical protein
MFIAILLGFPRFRQARRVLAIADIFSFFVNVYSPRLLPMPKGESTIDDICMQDFDANENFLLPMLMEIDAR